MMPASIHAHSTNSDSSIKLIFVVDDEVDIGMLVVQFIQEEMGHRAIHHRTGNQAIQACQKHSPHLLILDYGLPDMTGLELHDQIHAFDHLRNIPTLVISARRPPQKELRQREILYIAKPFDLTQMQNVITRLLA
jgi:CheY-like chemotaxis protein